MRLTWVYFSIFYSLSLPLGAATFRNHPNTLHPPVICAGLLEDLTNLGNGKRSGHELLVGLSNRLQELTASLPEKERNSLLAALSRGRFHFDWRNADLNKKIPAIAHRAQELAQDTKEFSDEKMVWLATVEGRDNILARLAVREDSLRRIEQDVRVALRANLHELRLANWLEVGAVGALDLFMTTLAIKGLFAPDFNLFVALMGIGSNGALFPLLAKRFQELGVMPIESLEGVSTYDIRFLPHIQTMRTVLKDFKPTDLVMYGNRLQIATAQFEEMKACRKGSQGVSPEVIAASCVFDSQSMFDIFSHSVKSLQDDEKRMGSINARWTAPYTAIDDILMADPQTGEPVLITAMRFDANYVVPPKKPKAKPAQRMRNPPGLVPAY